MIRILDDVISEHDLTGAREMAPLSQTALITNVLHPHLIHEHPDTPWYWGSSSTPVETSKLRTHPSKCP